MDAEPPHHPAEPVGELPASVEELILGGARKYARHEVAEKAGVPMERATELWQALGFAKAGDKDVVFTDADIESLRVTNELVQAGIMDPPTATATARMLGQHASRLAEWQVHMLWDVLQANPELASDERRLARFVERILPDLQHLQNFAWRRHLLAHAGRVIAAEDNDPDTRALVVGFADMVGFTSFTRRSDEAELTTVVDRFDAISAQTVAENHGVIVKMLGDEVLFVADNPTDGAEIALSLVERAEEDELLPSLRSGLAYGRVLSRYGDVYGSVVNIASRLTSIARPGTVLIDRDLAEVLEGADQYTVRSRRPASVRGYSRLRPYVLRRPGEEPANLVEAAQQRAAELLGITSDAEADQVPTPHIPLEPEPAERKRRRRRR
ncbi:adenylate cyclase [Herbihabitans rhizosphaerae]|uniref:Adenylate cyclase n=1 Tax=Herbihabitans rhizosphaerae TaxID=1872711 RepID=A0A4V2ERM6_9PSEU|nr:adenylate/guanylate cyclase domain-containing protein [Herbihabitans rhizosphaerae]RZS32479.1 adenylate cyclase [Herbihabitans rhizosphaerae]